MPKKIISARKRLKRTTKLNQIMLKQGMVVMKNLYPCFSD